MLNKVIIYKINIGYSFKNLALWDLQILTVKLLSPLEFGKIYFENK